MVDIFTLKSKLSRVTFFIAVLFFSVLPIASFADVPLAARLLSVSSEDTSQGGLSVSVTGGFGDLRGITNDGTTIYLLDASGNIATLPMSSLVGSPGSSIEVAGTMHEVGWGVGGAPSFGNPDGRSLAYSHGCLFINNDGANGTPDPINLYCIDTSDWSVTQIAVPVDEPLPAGHDWGRGTMIDFADGRIGKVSAYEATSSPESGYDSFIRMYTVTGTGKAATITWSHDYHTFDTENWNTDEHGVATDGTYLYRIEFTGDHLPDGDFKSWPLQDSGAPSQVYVGYYTEPFGNMTFLSHDHVGNRYMMCNYGGNQFYITSAADPGPGPGHPLTPAFGAVTSSVGGYTVQVTNYDPSFDWSATSTAGSASIDGAGVVTVSGLAENQSATTTVAATKIGVPNGSANISGTALENPPVITLVSSTPASTSTIITWTTDKIASSRVVYSPDIFYTSSTSEIDTETRVDSHTQTLLNLVSCASYHYKVVSTDGSGNTATSTDNTFTTGGCVGNAVVSSATSTLSDVSATSTTSLSDSSNTITVTTPANFTATSSQIVIQIKAFDSTAVLGAIGKPSSDLNSAASVAFDVKALIDSQTVLDSFDTPITITYNYSSSEITGLVESSLWMYHYHNGAWLALDHCSVNTGTKTITCTTPNFSTFALFGTPNSVNNSNVLGGGGILIPVTPTAIGDGSMPLTFTINDDSGITSNPLLKLHLNADFRTVKGYVVSLDPSFAGSSIVSYNNISTTAAFSLPNIPGHYTLYLKYYSLTGIFSKVLAQSIILSAPDDINTKLGKNSTVCKYTTSLRLGNRGQQVKDLQIFLKSQGTNIYPEAKVNGVFGQATKRAVIRFQEKYSADVLTPWGITKGTGIVYRTTKDKMCQLSKMK